MVAVVFMAETIPKFGAVLNLIGGSTITALTFIFPPLFTPILRQGEQEANFFSSPVGRFLRQPKHELVLNVLIMTIGLVGGVASTYSAVADILPSSGFSFSTPCYV